MTVVTPHDPRSQYETRLSGRRRRQGQLESKLRLLGRLRGTAALVLLGGLIWLFWWPAAGGLVLGLSSLTLAVIAVRQARERARLDSAHRSVLHYRQGLERLDGRWSGIGSPVRADEHHLYAGDLDLFGPGSLFESLCQARTASGERTLRDWLCGAASPEVIRGRQESVAELRPRIDLRERLAIVGEDIRAGVHPQSLLDWSARPIRFAEGSHAGIAAAISLATCSAIGLWSVGWIPTWSFLLPALVQVAYVVRNRQAVQEALEGLDHSAQELALLSQILSLIEGEPVAAPHLSALKQALKTDDEPPSRGIAKLSRIVELLDSAHNQFFAPIAALLLWRTQIAFALDRWRASRGQKIGGWMAAVGEFEALGSLSGWSFERPQDAFPEVVEDSVVLEAKGLGHPLLPTAQLVRNDVSLSRTGTQLLIVSGSNMSGKTTMLRTIGVNTALALAGSVVCAHWMRVSPLRMGATIRVQDSLREGVSKFYAEISKIRQVMELARQGEAVLVLFDEILHGTNSHDRVIGASAVLERFVELGAIGAVTTHDLALSKITQTVGNRARNVHFADTMEEGRLHFDYRLHEGIVRHSNALALMRAVGLEV